MTCTSLAEIFVSRYTLGRSSRVLGQLDKTCQTNDALIDNRIPFYFNNRAPINYEVFSNVTSGSTSGGKYALQDLNSTASTPRLVRI